MLRTGDLLGGRPEEELDRIDDELFATDYRFPSHRRHLTVLPEPPTVRMARRAPSRPRYTAVTGAVWTSGAGGPTLTYPASPYTADENGAEIIALVGLAVLLVVGVAATAVILVWWA